MVLILALAMVIAIVALEMWREKKSLITASEKLPESNDLEYETVEGIKFPKSYYFHPFHLWIKKESHNSARVGIDDYGRRLLGKINNVLLPPESSKVESGQNCLRLEKDDVYIPLASPLTGEIVERNISVIEQASLIKSDPYEEGWLFTIRSWNLQEQLGSLMSTDSAASWMRGAVLRMKVGPHDVAGAVAQDGGELVEDFHKSLHTFSWIQILRESMGTEPLKKTHSEH